MKSGPNEHLHYRLCIFPSAVDDVFLFRLRSLVHVLCQILSVRAHVTLLQITFLDPFISIYAKLFRSEVQVQILSAVS